MKPRLAIVLALIVVLPVLALAALGTRLIVTERQQAEVRTRALLTGQLAQHDARMQEVLDAGARALMQSAPETLDVETLEDALAKSGAVRHVFMIQPGRELTFPSAPEEVRRDASGFYRHVTEQWRNRNPGFIPVAEQTSGKGGKVPSASPVPPPPGQGWHTWYDEGGLRFLFWWRAPNGAVVGTELDKTRLMADLIAALPDTPATPSRATEGYGQPPSRMVLVDARGQDVYQWGRYSPADDAIPTASLALSAPFRSWRLDAYLEPGPVSGSMAFALALGLGALLITLSGLGVYFYRESTRALREAAQRITFANQVSHELKTPLTNIRMYAEMLEDDLEPDSRAHERLRVIVSESQRLSRLIGNILTFSRKQRHKLRLRMEAGSVGETVVHVLAHARPALLKRGIETVSIPPAAECSVHFDRDVVEQVLNNLVSNVEKYAAEGGYLGVAWEHDGSITRIRVEDHGPGVPEGEEERIFLPFYRVSNRLTDGVAGTGIGLSLARDLCRLHGGDLTVIRRGDGGLCFEATLGTPDEE